MSDNWVGPGWWMASDGKWYPPRTPVKDDTTLPTEPTRWSRRTPDGDPVAGATMLSSAESNAERAATRAERAARLPRPEPVSVKRPEEEGPLEAPVDAVANREPAPVTAHLDADGTIDLRDGVEHGTDDGVEHGAAAAGQDDSEPAEIDLRDDSVELATAGAIVEAGVVIEASKAAESTVREVESTVREVSAEVGRPEADATPKRSTPVRKPLAFAKESAAPPSVDRDFSDNGRSNGSIRTGSGGEQESMEPPTGSSSEPPSGSGDADDAHSPTPSSGAEAPAIRDGEQLETTRTAGPAPLRHAVLPALIEREPVDPRRVNSGLILLVLATGLAVLSGVLGAFWLRERSSAADLRAELERVSAVDDVSTAGLTELNDEVRTLRFQNEELQTRLDEMSALVLELPAGRVTEVAVPFTPVFADEVADDGFERLIAVSSDGQYVVWADGIDGSITGSGSLTGSPTGLFAATSKAWITTDAATIDVVSLLPEGEGLPTVDFGPVTFVAPEDRAYWTYEPASGDVVRLKKSDGSVTASARVPVPVVDLTIGAGSVWALGDDGRVYRINTADFTVQPIDAGADLISITAGPDALWTLSAADGSLRRVDAVSGEVLVTVPVGRDPIDATFAGSSVWVALRSGTSLIEVDTRTAAVISRTALPGEPTALHQGDSGVFVTLEGDVPLVRVASLTLPAAGDDEADDDDTAADDAG